MLRFKATQVLCAFATVGISLLGASDASAQSLAVAPVSIEMTGKQQATLFSVVNQGDAETVVQVRTYRWAQTGGVDQLTPTDDLVASPPLAKIAPGGTQLVRIVLRKPAEKSEETYRIMLDQVPAPASAGTVSVALRLSLPVFAKPLTPVAPRLSYHLERSADGLFLVAVNDGNRHDTVSEITLSTTDGRPLKLENRASPYVLAGATDRWKIAQAPGEKLSMNAVKMDATSDTGVVTAVPVAIVR